MKEIKADYSVENRILGINGSPRKKGNSDLLLRHLDKTCTEQRVEFKSANLREYRYSSCIGCEKCRKDKICTGLRDDLSPLYPHLLSSRGLVLISPAHNYNVTAWMKAFLDRLYCFYNFENNRPRLWSSRLAGENRKALIIGICEQTQKADMGFTMDAMERPLSALGYEVVSMIPVYGVFDRGAVKNDCEIMDRIEQVGLEFSNLFLSK